MIDVIKSVLDPNGTLMLSDDTLAVVSSIVLIISFILCVKFLFDIIRGLFPSFR